MLLDAQCGAETFKNVPMDPLKHSKLIIAKSVILEGLILFNYQALEDVKIQVHQSTR